VIHQLIDSQDVSRKVEPALAQLMRQWKAQRAAPAAAVAPTAASADIPAEVLERLEKELREIA
jgi:hypothetical protein